jgi:hypothetical protein
VVVQVTGKVRDRLLLRKDLPKAEARERALALPRVAELVPGAPRKLRAGAAGQRGGIGRSRAEIGSREGQ